MVHTLTGNKYFADTKAKNINGEVLYEGAHFGLYSHQCTVAEKDIAKKKKKQAVLVHPVLRITNNWEKCVECMISNKEKMI